MGKQSRLRRAKKEGTGIVGHNGDSLKKSPRNPSAIIRGFDLDHFEGDSKAAIVAIQEDLSPAERHRLNTLPPKIVRLLFLYGHMAASDQIGSANQIHQEWNRTFTERVATLRLHMHTIDVLVAANLRGKFLRDALDTNLPKVIADAYKRVAEMWEEWREYGYQLFGYYLAPDWATRRPDIKQAVDDCIAALQAVQNGDETLILALEPIIWNIDELLGNIEKLGNKADKLNGLRRRWREYERDKPDARVAEVFEAMLKEVATGNPRDGYIMLPELTKEKMEWFKSLTKKDQKGINIGVNPSRYRYDLLERR